MRERPSTDASIVTTLPGGTEVEILEWHDEWALVFVGEAKGFVHRQVLELSEAAGETPEQAPPQRKQARRRPPAQALRKGSSGEDVIELQRLLRITGASLKDDGVFGPATETALKAFQESQGLNATGQYNKKTRDQLIFAVGDAYFSGQPHYSIAQNAISDSPVGSLDEDRLGFGPSVHSLVDFLRSEETAPPLAIAIHAPWGRGKTSFMRMVSDQLEHDKTRDKRFVAAWFNPWKYDDGEQVWAAFVAKLYGKILEEIGLGARVGFEWQRFSRNFAENFDFAIGARLVVLLLLFVVLGVFVFDPRMEALNAAMLRAFLGEEALRVAEQTWVGTLLPLLAAVLIAHQIYTRVLAVVNEGLMTFLQKRDFSEKAGVLARFESEMKELNNAIPKDLRIIVFIDDLDRCKPQILSQIIEAMQLLTVTRKCIFVLGMDMNIVVRTVEEEYSKLNPEIKGGELDDGQFGHSLGYQFLEKIIQVQLSVPEYSADQMTEFAETLSQPPIPEKPDTKATAPGAETGETGQGDPAPDTTPEVSEPPRDDPEVTEAITKYGAQFFRNPRRLKRFVNTFRLHAYLARATGQNVSIDMLARFLILCEKYPKVVHDILSGITPEPATVANAVVSDSHVSAKEIADGSEPRRIAYLLRPEGGDEIDTDRLRRLAAWFGFSFYRPR